MNKLVFVPFLGAALLSSAPAAPQALSPGDYTRSFQIDGRTREYHLRVPVGYNSNQAIPLVLDLHGYTATHSEQRTLSGLFAVANEAGFALAHPAGIENLVTNGRSWNGGNCCGTAVLENVDDVHFLQAVAGHVARDVTIDAARIYVTGHSNGGAMTHRLGCEAAHYFAAIAPFAYPVPFDDYASCQPSRPVPILLSMGIDDERISYEAGAQQSFEFWRQSNGCAGSQPDESEPLGPETQCESYTACDDAVETSLCSVDGDDFGDGHLLYFNSDNENMARRAWDFMSRFQSDPPPVLVPEPAATAQLLAAVATLGGLFALDCRRRA